MVEGENRALEPNLLAAHETGDIVRLSILYNEAAQLAELEGDRDRAAFFLTNAWIFALEAGTQSADEMHDKLRSWGRCN